MRDNFKSHGLHILDLSVVNDRTAYIIGLQSPAKMSFAIPQISNVILNSNNKLFYDDSKKSEAFKEAVSC